MTEKHSATGHCLCGAVKLSSDSISFHLGACHCAMCRRWSSGPFFALDCGSDVTIEGNDKVQVYSSSEWAERGFCSQCGTNLFYRLKDGGSYFVSAGLFEDLANVTFDGEVFIDEKPAYYEFANETRKMTGAELFAKYSKD